MVFHRADISLATFGDMRWKAAQWLEKRWWRRYLRRRSVETYLSWKSDYWRGFLDNLDLEPRGNILDAGCGPAGIFMIFDGTEITAIDPLLESYESLPHFSKAHYPDVRFHNLRLEDLSVKVAYDWIFCINAINHVDQLEQAISRLADALKPGGKLVISIDCHNFLFYRWFLGIFPLDALHPHQLTLKEYQTTLEKFNLRVVREKLLKTGHIFNYYALVCEKD